MSTYIIFNVYLPYFQKIYNEPVQLEMVSQRDCLSQENLFNYYIQWKKEKKVYVKASANNLNNDIHFNHIIEHALSCTLEEDGKDVSNVSGLRFWTIHEVLNVGQMKLH